MTAQPPHTDGSWKRTAWRQGWFSSNIWLLFLLFPILSIADGDVSTVRKWVAIALVALFAVTYMFAFGEQIRRELGHDDSPPAARGVRWFAALLVIVTVAFLVGEWPVLAVLPFIVSFAMFHFSWRTVLSVLGLCVAASLVLPALGGVLADTWFFSVIIAGVAAATALIRMEEEFRGERHAFHTNLAVSDERHRVARDVHDVLGHSLTAVILKVQVCDRLLERLDRPDAADQEALSLARQQLAELDTVSRRALSEIRSTVGGLRAAELSDELAAARAVLADAGVALTVVGDPSIIDAAMRPTLGWVIREAVTNVVRHARASRCRIELAPPEPDGEHVLVRITDDGVGFGANTAGNGLTGLRERVEAAGAELRTRSSEGGVVEVVAETAGARR